MRKSSLVLLFRCHRPPSRCSHHHPLTVSLLGGRKVALDGILRGLFDGGTMACIAGNGCFKLVHSYGPPRIVDAVGGVILCGCCVSRGAGVSRCSGSMHAPPRSILTLSSIARLEDFFLAPPGRFKGVLILRQSPGAADSFLSLLN